MCKIDETQRLKESVQKIMNQLREQKKQELEKSIVTSKDLIDHPRYAKELLYSITECKLLEKGERCCIYKAPDNAYYIYENSLKEVTHIALEETYIREVYDEIEQG